jgi:hypothetical protein
MTPVSDALYGRLQHQAGPRCGYCRTSARIIGQPLTVEHIIPTARGGTSAEENLWLTCRRCNEFKGVQVDAVDPETATRVPLFNPRQQVWQEHFAWSRDGTRILGQTAVGRATVRALKLNNPDIVASRRLWVSVGWHPPDE